MSEIKLRKFKSLIDEKGLDDGGVASFTFEVDQLIKGKVYTQADQRFYDAYGKSRKPFFVDDNGCSRDIEFMLKNEYVEEVFDETTPPRPEEKTTTPRKEIHNQDIIDFRHQFIDKMCSENYSFGPICNDGSNVMTAERKKVLDDVLVMFNIHFSTRGYDIG